MVSTVFASLGFDKIARFRGYPKAIRANQVLSSPAKALDQLAYERNVKLKLIQPSKARQSASLSHSMVSSGVSI